MHPGPRCPRHPSGPWALVSGTPSLSRSAAFGLGAPFLRDIGVARSSGARGSHGRPHAHSHPWKPATRRAGFPVSAGWWAFALEEGRTKQEVSKVRKPGVWKAQPVPLSLSPASAAPPVNRRGPCSWPRGPAAPERRSEPARPLPPQSWQQPPLGEGLRGAHASGSHEPESGPGGVVGGARSSVRSGLNQRCPRRGRGARSDPASPATGPSAAAKPPQAWPRALQHSHREEAPRALPGGPGVESLCAGAGGVGSVPGQGAEIPQN